MFPARDRYGRRKRFIRYALKVLFRPTDYWELWLITLSGYAIANPTTSAVLLVQPRLAGGVLNNNSIVGRNKTI